MYPIRESRTEFIPAMPSVRYFAHRAMYPIKEMSRNFVFQSFLKIGYRFLFLKFLKELQEKIKIIFQNYL